MGTLVPLLTNTAAIDQGWPISRGAEARGAQIPQGARSLEAPLEFPRRQLWCRFHSNVKHFIFEVKISLSIFFLYLAACKFQAAASDAPHYVWQYFAVTNYADAKEGWARNAVICNFVTKGSGDEALPEQQHIS